MNTTEETTIQAQAVADLEYAVQRLLTGQRDEAAEERIRAQSEKIRGEVLRERGVLNVAVDLIREGREET